MQSLILPSIILAFSIYFLFKLKFFFILKPVKSAKKILENLSSAESRRSLCLALAGTLGVGNILGVAVGIIIGGAGCVFWIFLSGFFSAVIKYCECTLSADMSEREGGGMHRSIRHSFKKIGIPLSYLYVILCLALSLTMGTMIQSNAISSSFYESYRIPKVYTGIFLCVIILVILVFFSNKIDRITAIIIPITSIMYVIMMLAVIILNAQKLPMTLLKIVKCAFTAEGAVSGGVVSVNLLALKEGFARGLLSNEAGAGTSSMAQTRQKKDPSAVGLMGICEVFFDTTLLCTLTGLAICVGADSFEGFNTGVDLITYVLSESSLSLSVFILPLLIFMFALSTLVCWYYYGEECIRYLTEKSGTLYKILFTGSVFLGAVLNSMSLITLVDFILLAMSIITLFTLKKNSERIFHLSEKSGLLK